MKVWKDRAGNWITISEFLSRWKKGMKEVNAFQQTFISLLGMIIIVTGIFWGIVMAFISNTWWLFTTLIGSLFVASIQLLGTWQKYQILKTYQSSMKGGLTHE